jgi:hypothetical protein
MKQIAFVSNYYKTEFFFSVSRYLEKSGISVFWIVTSKYWLRFLRSKKVRLDRVLYLPRSIAKNKFRPLVDLNVNEIIYSDRALRYDPDFAEDYLFSIQKPVYNFLKNNDISFVFGEMTWGHEILINRLCRSFSDIKAEYLKPHTIRIPNGRFAFFRDEYEEEIYRIGESADFSCSWVYNQNKPDYFHKNNELNSFLGRVKRFPRKFASMFSPAKNDREDPCQRRNKFSFIIGKAKEELYYYLYYLFVKRIGVSDLPKMFWVYYMHKQPEASIDVLGRYYEDQFKNIESLAKKLPDECWLLVKEHPNAVGDRSPFFYRKVSALNRVIVVDERVDSHFLIDRSEITATVSGTVAYEAALMNKKAILFSKVFFSRLENVVSIKESNDDKKISIDEFKEMILINSFEGVISDSLSDPSCMDIVNVEKVGAAFECVIKRTGL